MRVTRDPRFHEEAGQPEIKSDNSNTAAISGDSDLKVDKNELDND